MTELDSPFQHEDAMGQQMVDAAHEHEATPDQMADAAAQLAEAALDDANNPVERTEVAKRLTERITPLILAAGVNLDDAIVANKIARLQEIGVEVDPIRIRQRVAKRRRRTI